MPRLISRGIPNSITEVNLPNFRVIEEDDVARQWRRAIAFRQAREAAWICVKFGLPLAAIAIFGVSRIRSGVELWQYVAGVIVVIAVMPLMVILTGVFNGKLKNRWELSERGIRILGGKRGRIRWSRMREFDFASINDLSGYTRVVLQEKSRFGQHADLVVKATEEELRKILLANGAEMIPTSERRRGG